MSVAIDAFTFRSHDGLLLAGERAGKLGAPSVVLLHGGGQTRYSWAGALRELVARGYYVVNLDARGHGASAWAPGASAYSLSHLSSDLRLVIDSLPNLPAVVGASMGGLTALHAIGASPVPIAAALVLVDVVPHMEQSGAARVINFMTAHRDGFATVEEAAAAVAAYNPHRPPPSNTDGLMRNLRTSATGRLIWHWDPQMLEMRGIAEKEAQDQLLARCRHFKNPALLVRGMQSDMVGESGIGALKRSLPQLELFDVAAAGHMVAGDKNDACNAALLGFLQRHMPG